jgi:hypothetical protein
MMKKRVQTGLIAALILLGTKSFGQTQGLRSEKVKDDKKTAKTYLDIVLNGVSTNFNYGGSNSALKDYKKSVLGGQAGVSFQAAITPKFSLVPEFYFMMKGGKLNAANPLTDNETTLRLYTLELPVLARFHVGKFYMNAGPSIAYNLGGTNKTANSSKGISFNNASEGFKRFDTGIQMGGGFEFPLKQKRVALDLRYNYGLTNISFGKEIYNRSFIVSVRFSKPWKTNPLLKNKNI